MSNTQRVKTYPNVEVALRECKDSIYVFNSSDLNGKQPKGQLRLSLGDRHDIHVLVPPTWIPFDLLQYGTREDVQKSQDLRNLVRSNYLIILHESEAERLMSSPSYETEKTRVLQLVNKKSNVGLKGNESTTVDIHIGNVLDNHTAQPNSPNQTNYISPQVSSLIQAQKDAFSSGDDTSLVSMIESSFPSMTVSDYDQILLNLENQSSLLYLAASDAQAMVNEGQPLNVKELPAFIERAAFT